RHARHPLPAPRSDRPRDGDDRLRDAARAAARLFHDEALEPMKKVLTEAKLLLIGIPVALWTLLPIYNMFLFSISTKEEAFSGKLWPDHPTLRNFEVVFREQHHFLGYFWRQLGNSLVIAIAVGVLTLVVAT